MVENKHEFKNLTEEEREFVEHYYRKGGNFRTLDIIRRLNTEIDTMQEKMDWMAKQL